MAKRSDKGRLPDFVGIGTMKAASTWLYQCLRAHPEVAMARKELNFFSDTWAYGRGIEHYAVAFSECPIERIAGEFSPNYMFVAETAARIRRWLPRVKIIVCLRDPVERAFSHYKFAIQVQGRLSLYPTFDDAIKQDDDIIKRGMYAEQLQRYYKLFPPQNVLVLMYDDVRENPAAMIRRLYGFVGVADASFVPPTTYQREHQTGDFEIAERLPLVNRVLYSLRHRVHSGGMLERLAVDSGASALARRVIKANRTRVTPGTAHAPARAKPVLHRETADRLYAMYREDGERLRQLLGRDIPWLH